MGGGNPISVAANFRLMFDTRSATRTATKYDAAMGQLASKGSQAMGQANADLQAEHNKLLKKVQQDNDIAAQKFEQRSNKIFSNVNKRSQESFSAAKKAAMEAAKGPRGGTSHKAYKDAEAAYTASLAKMDAANTAYVAHLKQLGVEAGGGIWDREAFGKGNIDERKLAIEATKEQIALTDKDTEMHKELTAWLNEQLRIDRSMTAAEKDLNRVRRQGGRLIGDSTRKLRMGTIMNAQAMKAYKAELMEANMQLQQMANSIKMGLTQALMTSAIVLVSFGFKLSQVTTQFKEFEQELMNANSIWQESNEVLYAASDTIVEFSTQYGIGLNEATEGLYQMASAGLTAVESQEMLQATLRLSMAVQGDHDTLSKLTIQVLKGFGMEMSEAAAETDKMAYAINKSLLQWEDLASGVKFAMPFFVSMNQETEQLYGALEVLSDRALEAGISGRGLRQALAQFAKHADDNTAAFNRMGIQIKNSNGEFLQLSEIAENFRAAFGDMYTDADMMTQLLEDFNVRGATAFVHLVQNAEEYQHRVDDLANSQGAAKEMADIQNQSLENQLQVMRNAAVASFMMSDATYEALGAMNEFDYLLQTAINDLRDFLFVQTETGLILSETGENLKNLVNVVMKQFIMLAREAYKVIGTFAKEGKSMASVINALIMPIRLVVQLLGMFGSGMASGIIMYKIWNTLVPMNSMLMMANAAEMANAAFASEALTTAMAKGAAIQAASNGLMFTGFYLINSESEAYRMLGQAVIFAAGAWQAYAIAKAAGVEAGRFGVAGLVAATVAGGLFASFMANMIRKAMEPKEFKMEALPELEYTTMTAGMDDTDAQFMDTGGVYMPSMGAAGWGLAMLQKGETVNSKTSNMERDANGITINIQGDVYDADNFTETVASVLPDAFREAKRRAF